MKVIPNESVKGISAIYQKNIVASKVGSEVSRRFGFESSVNQGVDLSLYKWIILMDFFQRILAKGFGRVESNRNVKLFWT